MSIILRTSNSPYGDTTKGSVLSQAELDGNFISLKGDVIYTAETSGGLVTLKKFNGNDITFTAGTGGGGTTYTVDNGLIENSTGNFQLGGETLGTGDLIRDTYLKTNGNIFRIDGIGGIGENANTLAVYNSGNGTGLFSEVQNGFSIRSVAFSGSAYEGIGYKDYTSIFQRNETGNTNTVGVLKIVRLTPSPTVPGGGLGGSIDFWVQHRATLPVPSPTVPTVSLSGRWQNPGPAVLSRLSRFDIFGYYSGDTILNFSLLGSGAAFLYQYGQGNFVSPPTYGLGVDADGSIVEYEITGGSSNTVNNGLTASTSNNFQLGGDLIRNTVISSTGFKLDLISNVNFPGYALGVQNSGNGAGIFVQSVGGNGALEALNNNGSGVVGASANGYGVRGVSNGNGVALQAAQTKSTTSTVETIAQLFRETSSLGANGIGGSLDFYVETDNPSTIPISHKLISKWTNATFASRVSQFEIEGVDNAISSRIFALTGPGQLILDKYGSGTFAGTPTYALGVDSSGNIVEFTASGGSGTFSGGTVTAPSIFTGGLSATTFSATTYLNLPLDVRVTGGTYSNGTINLINNTGGTFSVSGLTNINGDVFFTSGSSGTKSVKANNSTGLDATGNYSYAEGSGTTSSGITSHAEGNETIAGGNYSHAEGYRAKAFGLISHAQGDRTTAIGQVSHAQGKLTIAEGECSHAEGTETYAFGDYSHTEGSATTANGVASHAEGGETSADGDYSHAQGYQTLTRGVASHAGGYLSNANGRYSFVHGSGSTASSENTIVLGSNITGTAPNTVYVTNFVIKKIDAVPTSTSDTVGEDGSITWDDTYLYYKSNNRWKRISGSTF